MKHTRIELRTRDCTGCGRCIEACRRGVLQTADNGLVRIADADRCAGCRACERSCAHGAIAVRKNANRKPDIRRMMQGIVPILLALAIALPRSQNPADWHDINYWKIFGLFVLFHLLVCHLRIPKILKNKNKQ